jgi:poly(hydroxyalkanoate) depolymerase family esterase
MRTLLAIALLCVTAATAAAGTYEPVTSFGANPGALEMFRYRPAAPAPGAALVVFFHGCTQQAADARHVGWEQLADEYGFYIVYPQQTSANNPVQCFNWAGEYGDPANLVRGQGENQSVASMVARMKTDFDIDDGKVYAAGFSAGAAFAVVMLATWPDLFRGGAIMSGIPYRCAVTVNEAYSCQQLDGHPELQRTPAQWGDLVRAASTAGPPRPVVFFHGAADYTVKPKATDELLEQWTNLHGVGLTPDETATVAGHQRQRWSKAGQLVIEHWRVASMGHAVAMGAADPEHGCAPSGTYVEDRGLCAAWRAAVFLGIVVGGGGEDPDAGPGPGPGDPDAGAGSVPGDPTVAITAPGDGAVLAGGVTITATASDDAGIARVEFFIDGIIAGSDGDAPYSQFWQTSLAGEGEHEIRAVAYDLYESSAEAAIHVTVDQENGSSGGGTDLVDPIPCGCQAPVGRGAGGLLLVVGVLLLVVRRRP